MTNIIVGFTSQSGGREFQYGNIGTSRKKIILPNDYIDNQGLSLANGSDITSGVSNILEYVDVSGDINITMHSMAMSGIDKNYPQLLIEALRNGLPSTHGIDSENTRDTLESTKKTINALLISFHGGASEVNPRGSHTYYPMRSIKGKIERSLITSGADRSKIVDLEIFDSPSSKVLGFTFLGVVGQFVQFLECNKKHSIAVEIGSQLKEFLGDDYDKLLSFLAEYPLSGELGDNQKSMKDLGDHGKLNSVLNNLASEINFAKLSYISGVISDLYLELSMTYLRENKSDILSAEGDRFLLDWETIKDIFSIDQYKEKFDGLLKKRVLPQLKIQEKTTQLTSGVFVLTDTGDTKKCQFNPTQGNFDILGNNEVGGHFGIIPLFMVNGLVYDLGLLEGNEYIKSNRPISMIFMYNQLNITRNEDQIIIYNTGNPSEIFAKLEVGKYNNEEKETVESEILLGNNYNPYSKDAIAHGQAWIETLSENILPKGLFGLDIDMRAIILEAVGVKLARQYFIDPINNSLVELQANFPKLKDFSGLKGIFSKVETTYISLNFNEIINGNPYDITITSAKGGSRLLVFETNILVEGQIILTVRYTFS